MIFPEKPTCHVVSPVFKVASEIAWRPRSRDEEHGNHKPWRTCSYCGSIHPEDLLKFIAENKILRFGGADWKYGWPHKFYIDVETEETAALAAREEKFPGRRCGLNAKFYNEHIKDAGFDEEAQNLLLKRIESLGGIRFKLANREGALTLLHHSPYSGYQADWERDRQRRDAANE